MRRPTHPPQMSFFTEKARRPFGDRALTLRMGEVRLAFAGLDDDLRDRLHERFEVYLDPRQEASDGLQVEVKREEVDYFIDPPERTEFNPVLIACDGSRVRYLGYRVAGWFDVARGGGELLLGHGSLEPPERAMENYIRAAVAWSAAERGGALVHAAGAVWKGKAFLFYGESGAGKSTLSECNRRATVVSDDLSLVLPGANGALELVGSPFRGTYEGGEPVVGRFPLVAGFRIIKDTSAAVRPVPRPRALSELVGNLPFVAEGLVKRPDLFDRLESAFDGLPLFHLHFRKDDTYWDAIAQAGLAG